MSNTKLGNAARGDAILAAICAIDDTVHEALDACRAAAEHLDTIAIGDHASDPPEVVQLRDALRDGHLGRARSLLDALAGEEPRAARPTCHTLAEASEHDATPAQDARAAVLSALDGLADAWPSGSALVHLRTAIGHLRSGASARVVAEYIRVRLFGVGEDSATCEGVARLVLRAAGGPARRPIGGLLADADEILTGVAS